MKRLTKGILYARNIFHSTMSGMADAIETARDGEKYRRAIARDGFMFPLPQFIKRSIIRKAVREHACIDFVETGTYLGDTPWALRHDLECIYTIELSEELATIARRRFKNHPTIKVVAGDSSEKLREIVPLLKRKTLYWLDGHFSAGITAQGAVDCPIFAELETILTSSKALWVILIDDARCFGAEKDYPSVPRLRDFILQYCPTASLTIEHDIIQVLPYS